MPELLQNVATQATFVPALQLGPVKNCTQVSFVGIGQPFQVLLFKPDPHDLAGNPVQEGTPRLYPANGGDSFIGNISGAWFADAIAGQHAQIYASLAYATDPLSAGQSITSATITNTGQIAPSLTIAGIISNTGTWVGSGFTVVKTGTGVYQVTFTTPLAGAGCAAATSPVATSRLISANALLTTGVIFSSTTLGGTLADADFSFIVSAI